MARHKHKADFPTKVCQTCGRPFTWRKKWSECWDQVKYCSERCRRHRPTPPAQQPSETNLTFKTADD